MTDNWFLPAELDSDLHRKLTGLAPDKAAEAMAVGWEYVRCVVPEFTNWDRYLALARLTTIGTIAEFRADLVDVVAGEPMCGYDLDELLGILFDGTLVHELMAREYRSMLLLMTEKTAGRRDAGLFCRMVEALAHTPSDYFRIRDCDGAFRFFVAAGMACNDVTAGWLSDQEYQVLAEVGLGMYDAMAFHKHRAEGEICNLFAYADPQLRQQAYHMYREALWALDTAWSRTVAGRCGINFTRLFAGPIHMMMRRYRFVEDGLMIGRPETEQVVEQTRRNIKLWYRVDSAPEPGVGDDRYTAVIADKDRLLFPGLQEMLDRPDDDKCPDCRRRASYGAETIETFGGVRLCGRCRATWGAYLLSFPARAAKTLPLRASNAQTATC